MPKKNITKKKVLITLDFEIVKRLKRSKKPVSSHINEILAKHFLRQKNEENVLENFTSSATANLVPQGFVGSNPTLGAQVFSPSKINNSREILEHSAKLRVSNLTFGVQLLIINYHDEFFRFKHSSFGAKNL